MFEPYAKYVAKCLLDVMMPKVGSVDTAPPRPLRHAWLLIPLLGSYVTLEGLSHLVAAVMSLFGGGHAHLATPVPIILLVDPGQKSWSGLRSVEIRGFLPWPAPEAAFRACIGSVIGKGRGEASSGSSGWENSLCQVAASPTQVQIADETPTPQSAHTVVNYPGEPLGMQLCSECEKEFRIIEQPEFAKLQSRSF